MMEIGWSSSISNERKRHPVGVQILCHDPCLEPAVRVPNLSAGSFLACREKEREKEKERKRVR